MLFYGDAFRYWKNALQPSCAGSSTEAECIALSTACDSIIWIQNLFNELVLNQDTTVIDEDNSAAVDWATDTSGKEFSKIRHIDAKYHKIRDQVPSKAVSIKWISSAEMKANLMTKILDESELSKAVTEISLV